MIALEEVEEVGRGLVRPECVIAHASGLLFAADWDGEGGVAIVAPSGAVTRIEARGAPRIMRPNGIALEPGGTFLLADLGAEAGGVFRLYPGGEVEPVLTELAGRPFPPTNFVHRAEGGRLYVTVSTRQVPRDRGIHAGDGFIVLADDTGARIVADGLGYTNECHVDPEGRHLYVNETFARRLSRFPLRGDGTLGPREVVAAFAPGTYPDGLSFDEEGHVWITSIVSNRVIRVAPDGGETVLLEDCEPGFLAEVEAAWREGRLTRRHLDGDRGRRLRNVSSLAFGGPDLRIAYLGCLLGESIARFRAPVAGARKQHWTYKLGALEGLAEERPEGRAP